MIKSAPLILLFGSCVLHAADQPQWGRAWNRNMVSDEKGLPDRGATEGPLVKWSANLGTESYSTPVISGGRVYIGTNNETPRDERHKGDRGVLMCFDEKDGHLHWQLVTPKRSEDRFFDWPRTGISSPATVEGNRVYVVSNRGEVLCLDANGMADGNDGPYKDEAIHQTPEGDPEVPVSSVDADIIWRFDLMAGAGIWPHDAAHSSILIRGPLLYVNSGTGVDNTHKKIRTPDAPSLVVFEKATGRYVARDGENMAPNIFHSTWSAPSLATVQGRDLLFFGGGNGILYAFEPIDAPSTPDTVLKLKKVWQFDPDPTAPKENIHAYNSNRQEGPSNLYGMPVVVDGRVYFTGGGDFWWGKTEAWFKCIDAAKPAAQPIWSCSLNKHVMATPAIHEGLAYLGDTTGTFYCVRADTGKVAWTHETGGEIWGSGLVADGKVFIGNRRGKFCVFATGAEKRVLSESEMKSPISATPVAANGVLYIATMKQLFALRAPEKR